MNCWCASGATKSETPVIQVDFRGMVSEHKAGLMWVVDHSKPSRDSDVCKNPTNTTVPVVSVPHTHTSGPLPCPYLLCSGWSTTHRISAQTMELEWLHTLSLLGVWYFYLVATLLGHFVRNNCHFSALCWSFSAIFCTMKVELAGCKCAPTETLHSFLQTLLSKTNHSSLRTTGKAEQSSKC